MPDITSDDIADAALDPQSVTTDGNSAAARPLPDVIAADKYVKGTASVDGTNDAGGSKSPWRGLRMGRAIPPGAV